MLYMSAHITKELGMAPGSEFRTAFNEAKKYVYILATTLCKQIFYFIYFPEFPVVAYI